MEGSTPHVIDDNSLIFLIDLLNCILDDFDDTLIYADIPLDRARTFSAARSRLSSAFQILNNYNERKRYK